jgi:hypothetical protein
MVEVLTKHAAELPCCVVSDSLLALGFPLFGRQPACKLTRTLPPECHSYETDALLTVHNHAPPPLVPPRQKPPPSPLRSLGPNAASDRATPLLALPPTCRVTFVSGDKDEFLSRDYMAEKGPAALAAVVGRMQAQATVVVVSGGKHNPLGVGKKAFLKAKATFVDAVQKHVAAAAAATTATTTARSSSSEK